MTPPGHVCVVQFRRIGDVLLTTPLLGALRAAWPNTRISVLVDRGCHEPLLDHPWVDDVWDVPRAAWRAPHTAARQIVRMRRSALDATIDVISTPASAVLCALSGAGTRVGFDLRVRRAFYTHPVERPLGATYVARARQSLLGPVGVAPCDERPRLAAGFARREWASDALRAAHVTPPFVCVSPTSRRAHRRWPLDRFAHVARMLAADGLHVCVLWGPGERGDAEEVVCAASHARVVCAPETPDLRALAGVLARSALLVGNDNGVRHLAVALDVSTVGVFGANDPAAWTPPFDARRAEHRTLAGAECSEEHIHCTRPRCIRGVPASLVLAEARAAVVRAGCAP